MLKNSELKVNQGCNLKWKPGDKLFIQFSLLEILRIKTVVEPLYL